DADDAAVARYQLTNRAVCDDIDALRLCRGEQGLRGGERLDRAFFRNIQREIRRTAELRFDPCRFGAVHAADAISPGRMFLGIGFELIGWNVPDQSAEPRHAKARYLTFKTPPFRHGADAQAEVDFGIAPAGIDPGP